jgi:toxin HigB-1
MLEGFRLTVTFRTKQLERCYVEHKAAVREFGKDVARRYIERINIIKQTASLEELARIQTLRCHPLKGDRAGHHAITLTGFMRLIFSIEGESLTVVRIEEVSKHYDD